MCQMDIDINNQSEQTTLLNLLIYAVDEHGICHPFETETLNQLQPISINTEEKMDVSKSIVVLSNQIDNSLQLTNEDFIQNSSNFHSVEYLSTQPFSILDLQENNLSSLHLFNNDISTPILSPPLQLSGHIASQYQNVTLINSNDNISKIKKKKKKKKLRYPSRRFTVLKQQFKAYLKNKKNKHHQQNQYHLNNISNIIVHHQSQQIESSPNEHSTMIDFQLPPDLSKRKYIYKDITLSNNNNNQNSMNWRIFQCTQQSSSMTCFDQTVTNDCSYHPFYCTNKPISLPDIRIGLSRHHTIKQLHKTIID